MTRRLIILLYLVVLIIPARLWAIQAPQPFVTVMGGSVSFQSLEDDQGGFYLVWVEEGTDRRASLHADHIDGQKHALWNSLIVSSRLVSTTDWSGLADGKGGLTLFWDEADGMHAQRFRPDGTQRTSGSSVLLSTAAAIQPATVSDALGQTLLVWRENLSAERSVIKAQCLDQDLIPQWPGGGIRVSLRASSQMNPRAVFDNVSGMIVGWRDVANEASELRVQRIDFSGNRLWSLEGLKITAPVGASEYPTLASAGTGEVVVAWTAQVSQTSQIVLQRIGPEPRLKWGHGVYASASPDSANRWNPMLMGDAEGGTWVGWEDFRNQINFQIQLNHLHKDGRSAWDSGEIAIAPAQGDQGKMSMAQDGKDGVWLGWIDNRLSTVGLYVQNVDGMGRRLQGAHGRLIAGELHSPSYPQLVPLGPGRMAVVWADRSRKNQWTLSWTVVGDL